MTEPHFSKQKSSCLFTAVSRHSTCRHFFREICVFQNRTSDAKDLGVDPEMLSTDSYLTDFIENSAGPVSVIQNRTKQTTWRHTLSEESCVPLPGTNHAAEAHLLHLGSPWKTFSHHCQARHLSWVSHISCSEYSVWLHRKGIVVNLCTVGRPPHSSFCSGQAFVILPLVPVHGGLPSSSV